MMLSGTGNTIRVYDDKSEKCSSKSSCILKGDILKTCLKIL